MAYVYKGRIVWTPEMDRELVNMFDYGVSKSEIAEKFGVSLSAVDGRYYKLKRQQREQGDD